MHRGTVAFACTLREILRMVVADVREQAYYRGQSVVFDAILQATLKQPLSDALEPRLQRHVQCGWRAAQGCADATVVIQAMPPFQQRLADGMFRGKDSSVFIHAHHSSRSTASPCGHRLAPRRFSIGLWLDRQTERLGHFFPLRLALSVR